MSKENVTPQERYYQSRLKQREVRKTVRLYDGLDDDIIEYVRSNGGDFNKLVKEALRKAINK